MNTRLPSKAGVQCNKEFESESKCESDAEGKVVRIGHALKVDTGHHRFMEPSRNTEHMLRDAHGNIINILRILRSQVTQESKTGAPGSTAWHVCNARRNSSPSPNANPPKVRSRA